MNLNLTIVGQSVAFLFFVWFCASAVWPRFIAILDKRKRIIKEGLQSAEQGRLVLKDAELNVQKVMLEAKRRAEEIVSSAHTAASRIEENSRKSSLNESKRIIDSAKLDVDLLHEQLQKELKNDTGDIAIMIAEKIIEEKIDKKLHDRMINDLVKQL